VDRVINTNQLPPNPAPPALNDRPAFLNVKTDAWIQALSLGAEFTW
jgi:hypothetical protein